MELLKGFIVKCLVAGSVLLVAYSCGGSSTKNENKKDRGDVFHSTDTLSRSKENPKISEFKTFVSKLDSSDVVSASKALEKYKQLFDKQSPALCDSGFVVFQSLYDSLETHLNMKHQNDTTNYEPLLSDNQSSVPKKLKDFQRHLLSNGFKISSSEGVTYIEQDRAFVARNFYSFVTPEMKAYLNELQKENKEGFAANGAISITPSQLVDRTVWYELFLAKYPDFVFIGNCKDYHKAYLTYLLCGYENTTIYKNKEAQEISGYYINAYSYLNSRYHNSEVAKLVNPYYESLKQKQASSAQSILKNYRIKGLIFSVKW
jgi:hypothetical protein